MKKNFLLLWGILLSALTVSAQEFGIKNSVATSGTHCYSDNFEVQFVIPESSFGASETFVECSVCLLVPNGKDRCRPVGSITPPNPGTQGVVDGTVFYNDFGTGNYYGVFKYFVSGLDTPRVVKDNDLIFLKFNPLNFKINWNEATLSLANPSVSNVLSCQGVKITSDCAGSDLSISIREVNADLSNVDPTDVYKELIPDEVADLKNNSLGFDVEAFASTNGITFTEGHTYSVKLIDRSANGSWIECIKFFHFKGGDFDLYMKDNEADNGYESTDPYPNVYASPDLWNRLGTTPFTYDTKHQNIDYSTSQYNRAYIRIHNQGCTASTESKLYMYWTRARLDEQWDKFWKYDLTNNYVPDPSNATIHRQAGGEITLNDIDDPSSATKELTIPAGIEPNAVYSLVDDFASGQEWLAPNPAWYDASSGQMSSGTFQGVQRPIICMLARLTNPSDPISFSSTSTPIDPYVRKNNNVVTRNSALVDDPAFFVSNPSGWNHGWNTVMVNNSRSTSQIINLHLDIIPEETNAEQPFSDFGDIYLGLDDDLWTLWKDGGELGSGFEVVVDGILRVTDYNNVVLEGIDMKDASFNENYTLGVRFDYFSSATAPSVPYYYAYQISQTFPSLENIHGSNAVLYTSVQPTSSKTGALNTPQWKAEEKQDKINVYPNPFDGNATALVNIAKKGNYTIAVKDIMGRTIETLCNNCELSQGKHNFAIDGAKYDAGVYFVAIFGGDSQNTIKIIKQE